MFLAVTTNNTKVTAFALSTFVYCVLFGLLCKMTENVTRKTSYCSDREQLYLLLLSAEVNCNSVAHCPLIIHTKLHQIRFKHHTSSTTCCIII